MNWLDWLARLADEMEHTGTSWCVPVNRPITAEMLRECAEAWKQERESTRADLMSMIVQRDAALAEVTLLKRQLERVR